MVSLNSCFICVLFLWVFSSYLWDEFNICSNNVDRGKITIKIKDGQYEPYNVADNYIQIYFFFLLFPCLIFMIVLINLLAGQVLD